jgi:general stress protein 26
MKDLMAKAEKLAKNKKAVAGSVCDNKPFIKAMLVAKREGFKTFYFASNTSSMRAKQYEQNNNACLYFFGGILYKGLLLEGKMEVIYDKAIKEKIWNCTMKSVYKGGVNDPDYCVLKFTAIKGRFYCMFKSNDFEIQ